MSMPCCHATVMNWPCTCSITTGKERWVMNEEGILDPEELFWDELAIECGFSPLSATSRSEFLTLVKSVIRQLEIHENKIGEIK